MSVEAHRTASVIIIGAGPAGLTTALQLQRYGVHTLVFEQGSVGGLLNNANWIENYPGFPGGISGRELVALFEQQALEIGVNITREAVIQLDYHTGYFHATTPKGRYQAQMAVVASGTVARPYLDASLPKRMEDRLFYEIAQLLDVRDKHIAIIGAGDAAFDYALNLGRRNRVTILNRGESVSCLILLWERACSTPNVDIQSLTRIVSIASAPHDLLELTCATPGADLTIDVDYLVAAIGRDPKLDFLSPSLLSQADELAGKELLYLIGDVQNGLYRQTTISVGDGMLAAMQIYNKIKERAT